MTAPHRTREAQQLRAAGLTNAEIGRWMGIGPKTLDNYLRDPMRPAAPTRVLIVGRGRMGRIHERVLRELGCVVRTLDPDPAADANYVEWSDQVRADVACIAVPIPQLSRAAKKALMAGMDVLVEKPGAASRKELLELHAIAMDRDLKLSVGFVERWNGAVQRLRHSIGLVGPFRHICVRRLGLSQDQGTEPLLDLLVHDADLLSGDLGIAFDSVQAQRTQGHVSALLKSRSVTVTVESSHLHPVKTRTIEVVGEKGLLIADLRTQTVTHIDSEGETSRLPIEKREPLKGQWEAFFAGHHNPGLRALALAEWIEAACATDHEPVRQQIQLDDGLNQEDRDRLAVFVRKRMTNRLHECKEDPSQMVNEEFAVLEEQEAA